MPFRANALYLSTSLSFLKLIALLDCLIAAVRLLGSHVAMYSNQSVYFGFVEALVGI